MSFNFLKIFLFILLLFNLSIAKTSLGQSNDNIINKFINVFNKDKKLKECFSKTYECAFNEFSRKNFSKSFSILKYITNKFKDPIAMRDLAYHYQKGYGTAIDLNKSFQLYKKAAESGNSNALADIGLFYSKGIHVKKNINKAIENYLIAADKGNSFALYNLGIIYIKGNDVPKNFNKGFDYINKAARFGNLFAKTELGYMYENGDGVSKNLQKSKSYFLEAAKKNHPGALAKLGFNYYKGIYGEKDLSKAFNYWKRAEKFDNSYSLYNLGRMYLNGEFVLKNEEKAYEYTRKAANLNFASAYTNLGYMYDAGIFLKKDLDTAIKLYQIAAELGEKTAQSNLEKLNKGWTKISSNKNTNFGKGFLGVEIGLNDSKLNFNKTSLKPSFKNKGVIIKKVFEGSPAFRKLNFNDIILKIDNYFIDTTSFVIRLIQEKQKCDELGVTILRNGKLIKKTIILGDLGTKRLCRQNYTKVAKEEAANNKIIKSLSKISCQPKYASNVTEAKNYNWDNCVGIIKYTKGKWKGFRYEGEFLNGLMHGKGVALHPSGGKYQGESKFGKRNGIGKYAWTNGDKYIGEWKNDKKHGHGTYFYLTTDRFKGDIFVGEYLNGKRDGIGTYFYKNGTRYIGQYKSGKRHGEGALLLSNGKIKEGIWKNNKYKSSKINLAKLIEKSNSIKDYSKRLKPNKLISEINKPKSEKISNELKVEKEKRLKEERKRKALEKEIAKLKQKNKELQHPKKNKQKSSNEIGSGFYVSKFRHIITNQHVVNECKKITVGDSMTSQIPADLIASDKRNDLAILQTVSMEMASADTKSFLEKLAVEIVPVLSGGLMRSEDVSGGEEIFVAGYPLGNMVSDQMKLTDGIVSATKGLDNDVSRFEISSVVRKGNSGGPIYDSKGNIVGVVVERFNVNRSDNVNFAIKGSTVKQFLFAHNVSTKLSNRQDDMSTKDIYKIASKQTVMVLCHR